MVLQELDRVEVDVATVKGVPFPWQWLIAGGAGVTLLGLLLISKK